MFDRLKQLASKFFAAVGKEGAVYEELHEETEATRTAHRAKLIK